MELGQLMQLTASAVAPYCKPYFPAKQFVHVDADVAVALELYFPGAHAVRVTVLVQ